VKKFEQYQPKLVPLFWYLLFESLVWWFKQRNSKSQKY